VRLFFDFLGFAAPRQAEQVILLLWLFPRFVQGGLQDFTNEKPVFYSIVPRCLCKAPIFHKIFSEITFLHFSPHEPLLQPIFVQEKNPEWSNMAIGEI
jgi:hypothetical protein